MPDRDATRATSPLTIVLLVGVVATFLMLVLREPAAPPQPALVAPIVEHAPDAGDDFVPNLPAVPDLARDRARRAPAEADTEADPVADALAQEMRLVREARSQIETDPSAALELLAQHRQRFPRGALAEEREAYAILAMIVAEAAPNEVERRFTDLLADHPGSAFAPTIREAIEARTAARQAEGLAP